ncbi:glycerophosphodiester phosphodiesterase family protein [Sporosarcina sp. E16_8]|uniref:glycerophosphodiester phosphodiesterase n=1 Tax=Sporosarcina sp. E16_8 TaxID=2789295 RepID=UPI001A93A622|nr:glycerophosphodiester phosphodiesterase family protein [Sporosarcina sp. E16_8]MBO0586395.1 glycerophosphodiester phosphodiesterase [Sporosarcina sp. E16_8]
MSNPTVFAHRGSSGIRFENTMKAFEKAVDQGAGGIELDVQLTEDGVPFVIHDPGLSRLAGTRKMISSMTSIELMRVRVGRRYRRLFCGYSIPTLIEAVSFCEKHRIALNVELKETVSDRPELIKMIVDIVSVMENVHISSFDYRLLEVVKRESERMETAFLIGKKSVDWTNLNQYSCADGLHFHKRLLKEPYLTNLLQSGKKIRVYGMTGTEPITLNPPPYIDGWITDYPNRFYK